MRKNGKDQVIKYMIRYAGKPSMAQSRVISYNHETKDSSQNKPFNY